MIQHPHNINKQPRLHGGARTVFDQLLVVAVFEAMENSMKPWSLLPLFGVGEKVSKISILDDFTHLLEKFFKRVGESICGRSSTHKGLLLVGHPARCRTSTWEYRRRQWHLLSQTLNASEPPPSDCHRLASYSNMSHFQKNTCRPHCSYVHAVNIIIQGYPVSPGRVFHLEVLRVEPVWVAIHCLDSLCCLPKRKSLQQNECAKKGVHPLMISHWINDEQYSKSWKHLLVSVSHWYRTDSQPLFNFDKFIKNLAGNRRLFTDLSRVALRIYDANMIGASHRESQRTRGKNKVQKQPVWQLQTSNTPRLASSDFLATS